jgi:TonB family protein
VPEESPGTEARTADLSPAESAAKIPESIRAPFPGSAAIHTVAMRIGPTLLGALEPISLPEDLANKLLQEKVQPSYPEKALKAGLQGPVILQTWIGRDGRIRDLKLIRGSLLLGQAACNAVKQWRYKPYFLNGQAVEAQTYVTVDFKLPQS